MGKDDSDTWEKLRNFLIGEAKMESGSRMVKPHPVFRAGMGEVPRDFYTPMGSVAFRARNSSVKSS